MSTIYVVYGYINSNHEDYLSINVDECAPFKTFINRLFDKTSNLALFSDKESAQKFQLTTVQPQSLLFVKQWQILFEVELKHGINGYYIDKLMKANFMTSTGNTVEKNLDYLLPSNKNLLSNSDIERLNTFILCNEHMEDSSVKLLPEISEIIFDRYQQLAFFREKPPEPKAKNTLVNAVICTIL